MRPAGCCRRLASNFGPSTFILDALLEGDEGVVRVTTWAWVRSRMPRPDFSGSDAAILRPCGHLQALRSLVGRLGFGLAVGSMTCGERRNEPHAQSAFCERGSSRQR